MARYCNIIGAAATLLLLLLITTAADDLGSSSGGKCGGGAAECAAARGGGGNEEMWMMEPETTRGFINPVFLKYHSICYSALRMGPICFAARIGSCFGEKRNNVKRNCDFFNRSCLRG